MTLTDYLKRFRKILERRNLRYLAVELPLVRLLRQDPGIQALFVAPLISVILVSESYIRESSDI